MKNFTVTATITIRVIADVEAESEEEVRDWLDANHCFTAAPVPFRNMDSSCSDVNVDVARACTGTDGWRKLLGSAVKNQCDGCRSGLKLVGDTHFDQAGSPVMACQKEKYKK